MNATYTRFNSFFQDQAREYSSNSFNSFSSTNDITCGAMDLNDKWTDNNWREMAFWPVTRFNKAPLVKRNSGKRKCAFTLNRLWKRRVIMPRYVQ